MDPATAIITALIAGAAAAAKDTASIAIKDSYAGLKKLLSGRMRSLPLVEADHESEAVKRAATEEIEKTKLADDAQVREEVTRLLEALAKEPRAALGSGIDLERLKAAKDIIVVGNQVTVRAHDLDAGGNIQIGDNTANR